MVNLSGTRTLGRVAMAGFVAELIGALFVGIWLLLFERHHDFSVLFDSLGTGGDGGYLGAFLAAALLGLYLFYGFEACGDVAEEVPDPGRTIPKAMRRTIYIGGFARPAHHRRADPRAARLRRDPLAASRPTRSARCWPTSSATSARRSSR